MANPEKFGEYSNYDELANLDVGENGDNKKVRELVQEDRDEEAKKLKA